MRAALLAALALSCAAGPRATLVERPAWRASLSRAGDALTVTLEARGDYHLNAEYPIHFRFADADRRVERDAFTFTACPAAPAEPCAARATFPLAGLRPRGTLAFSVCNANECLIEKVPLVGASDRS